MIKGKIGILTNQTWKYFHLSIAICHDIMIKNIIPVTNRITRICCEYLL